MFYKLTLALFVLIAPGVAQTPRRIQTIEMDGRQISYAIDGPYAVTQGDIILGKASEMETWRIARERGTSGPTPKSLHQVFGSTGAQLWPNGILYYSIDPGIANPQPILDGVAQWNSLTHLQVLPRTDQPNYVVFVNVTIDAACDSSIGMVGGAQDIGFTSECDAGSVAHELGHAFGLLHEQQRLDRGGYVTVLYGNIDKRFYSDFYQSLAGTATSGYYDFGSLMHYPWYGFSNNLQDTVESVPVGIPIGQRNALSAGDVDGANRLYGFVPSTTTITTVPEGLQISVDGAAAVSPQSYNWVPGTQHTVGVQPAQQIDPHYLFANWSDGGAATHSLTASADQTVFCANFVVEHMLAVQSLGGGTAAASPVPAGGYLPERYPFELRATPAPGFQFLGWGGFGVELPLYGGDSSSASTFSEILQSPFEDYFAVFTNAPIMTIDSQPRGLRLAVDGVVFTTPLNLPLSNGLTHTLSPVGTQYSGNNTARYQFRQWEDGSTGTRTVTAPPNGGTYTAHFNTQYLLSTGVFGTGTVTVSPASPDGFYDAGTTVQLSAASPSGVLRYWVGDLSSNQNPATVVMDQQRVVGANLGPALPFRVLSAASFTGNANIGSTGTVLAPGELVAIFGDGIGPASAAAGTVDSAGKFPFSLAGYQVTVNSIPAPLIYAGPNQINAIVPFGVAGAPSSSVTVVGPSGSLTSGMSLTDTAPSLFTATGSGTGGLAALNEDGTLNSPANPAARGSVVVLFGTGAGAFDKRFADGLVTGADLGHIAAPVWVRFEKLPAAVTYSGSAPYQVNGVFQINARIPADLTALGQVPVQVIVGSYASPPGTTISVK